MLDLELSNDFMEKVSISLVREFLVRRGLFQTLKILNRETNHLRTTIESYRSRRALAKDLQLGNWMRLNKETPIPLQSMLEVLIKAFLQDLTMSLHNSSKNKPLKELKGVPKNKKAQLEKNRLIGTRRNTRETPDNRARIGRQEIPIKDLNTNTNQSLVVTSIIKAVPEADDNPTQLLFQQLQESRNPATSHSRQSEDQDHEDEDSSEQKTLINGEIFSNTTTDHRDPQIQPLPPFTQRALFSRANRSSISRDSVDSGDTALSHLALGQNLLESKQNLLAKVNLSAADDELRQRAEEDGLLTESEEFLHSNSNKTPSRSRSMNLSTESSEMKLSKIESNCTNTITHSDSGIISVVKQRQDNLNPPVVLSQDSFEIPENGSLNYQKKTPKNMQRRVKATDMATWREQKALVVVGYPRRLVWSKTQ